MPIVRAAWKCAQCGHRMAPDVHRCPKCGCTEAEKVELSESGRSASEQWARSVMTGALAILVAVIVWAFGSRMAVPPQEGIADRQRRAETLEHAGDFPGAVAEYEAIAQARPDVPGNWQQLGLALLKARRYEQAGAAFRQGLEQVGRPRSPDQLAGPLHYNLAFALAHTGDATAAGRELEAAADAEPAVRATVDYNALMGVALAARGRQDSARASFARASAASRADTLTFINAWLAERPTATEAPLLEEVAASLREPRTRAAPPPHQLVPPAAERHRAGASAR
jgi:hypothetical protein